MNEWMNEWMNECLGNTVLACFVYKNWNVMLYARCLFHAQLWSCAAAPCVCRMLHSALFFIQEMRCVLLFIFFHFIHICTNVRVIILRCIYTVTAWVRVKAIIAWVFCVQRYVKWNVILITNASERAYMGCTHTYAHVQNEPSLQGAVVGVWIS